MEVRSAGADWWEAEPHGGLHGLPPFLPEVKDNAEWRKTTANERGGSRRVSARGLRGTTLPPEDGGKGNNRPRDAATKTANGSAQRPPTLPPVLALAGLH